VNKNIILRADYSALDSLTIQPINVIIEERFTYDEN